MIDIYRPDKLRDTLETLIQNLPGFVYRCKNDEEWTMIFVSDQCEQITGYAPEELIDSKDISYNQVIEPSYRDYLHSKWIEIISEKALLKEEYRIVRKDGAIRWVREQGRGVFDAVTGELLYLDGYIVDITERVEAFDKLITINEDLIIANRKREEANSLKSFFLSNLSHEIRTPLNAIMGFTEILKEEGLPESDKKDYIEIIHRSNHTLLNIIEDIVIASKIEVNQIETHLSLVNLQALCSNIYEVLQEAIPLKTEINTGVKIDISNLLTPYNRNVNFTTDYSLVTDIVKRLFDNAVRYTEQGQVDVKVYLNNDSVVFEIKDSGIGIDPLFYKQIMKSFYRLDNPINTRTRGAGLGLFICKAYTTLIGAHINFTSQEGRGATFSLQLPLCAN